jgi:hypothetical protein
MSANLMAKSTTTADAHGLEYILLKKRHAAGGGGMHTAKSLMWTLQQR